MNDESFQQQIQPHRSISKEKDVIKCNCSNTSYKTSPYFKKMKLNECLDCENSPLKDSTSNRLDSDTSKQQKIIVTTQSNPFSFYRAVWRCAERLKTHATSALNLMGVGISPSYHTTFVARMTDCNHKRQFALCIQAYRPSDHYNKASDGNKNNAQLDQQYPLLVGSCTPRTIPTGKIRIRQVFTKCSVSTRHRKRRRFNVVDVNNVVST